MTDFKSQIFNLRFAIWNPEGPAHGSQSRSPRRTVGLGRGGWKALCAFEHWKVEK